MLKGLVIADLAVALASMVVRYMTHRRYTDAALLMAKEIGRSFGV